MIQRRIRTRQNPNSCTPSAMQYLCLGSLGQAVHNHKISHCTLSTYPKQVELGIQGHSSTPESFTLYPDRYFSMKLLDRSPPVMLWLLGRECRNMGITHLNWKLYSLLTFTPILRCSLSPEKINPLGGTPLTPAIMWP